MKKVVFILLVCLFSFALFGEEDKIVTKKEEVFKFGPAVSYFGPKNSDVKSIYGSGGAQFGFQLGVRVWSGLSVWLTASMYKADGKTSLDELQNDTEITLYPVTLHLRYNFLRKGVVSPYIGGGYTYLYFKENSQIGDEEDKGHGYNVEGGLEFKFTSHFSIDLNARYMDVEVDPAGEKVSLGGFSIGMGFLINL